MDLADLEVDPDIRVARPPAARLYTDPALQARLVERVLRRSWLGIAENALHEAPVEKGEGVVVPDFLLPGVLDEPIVWTRDGAGAERVLANVCTHRGHPVVLEAGEARRLRCRYHGRRFELDGRCINSPGFEDRPGFPCDEDHLQPLPMATLGPLRFVSLDPMWSFAEWTAGLHERLGWWSWDELALAPSWSRDFEFDAHWALYVENYLEGLHIPFVHPGLDQALDFANYRIDTFPTGSVQVGVAAPGERALDPPEGSPDAGLAVGGYYVLLFPTTMLNVYPWGLSVNLVEPLGPARTRVRFRRHVCRPEWLEQGAGSDLFTVEMEDEEVVTRVQQALGSRLRRRGGYAPRHEVAVHQFHRWLIDRLRDEGSPSGAAGPRA